ncbi:hypothetical protein ACFQ48_20305 [Hymenobacter caeli]|uniref:LapA family protein n=1 Tax=Hymenobacter caeli TaxID=2735894 RepID=A0ABX2FWE6_9BACT|nr:hypothetical protein [Hymenobacter caeli]NRT21307.1 hypothetical protein [Hymenobacter caeli]
MVALKRFVSVVVMVYLLLALLFLLVPAVRASVAGFGAALSDEARERDFFQMLATIGAVIMAVQLVIENLDSSLLRRSVAKQDGRINELKAKLYDHQQTASRVVPNPGNPNFPGNPGFPGNPNFPADRYAAPNRPPEPARPMFPQSDPSLPNTPPAERPPL